MRKVPLFYLLPILAYASKDNFPEFDSTHAHCAMEVMYSSQTCVAVYAKIYAAIASFTPEPKANGTYTIIEEESYSYIWTTRTTPVKKYVDDILFEFEQEQNGC